MTSKVDLKVVMLGKEYVGKTSLVNRFLNDRFIPNEYQNTIGGAYCAKRITVNNKLITMGIWDTAGSEKYEAMARIYYRGAYAALVCYQLNDQASFARVRYWTNEVCENETSCKIFIVGTKKDLLEESSNSIPVNPVQVASYADSIQAEVFETSSKTGKGVDELFRRIAEIFVSDPSRENETNDNIVQLTTDNISRGTAWCCGRNS